MSGGLRRVANGGFRLLGAATILFFVVLLVLLAVDLHFALVSRDWPSTIGRMTENVKVPVQTRVYVQNWSRRGGYYTTRTTIERHLKYCYSVDAHEYIGTRSSFLGGEPSDELAIERLHGEVQVFYDPQKPSRSVLLPGVRRSVRPEMGGLLVGLGFGLVLAYSGVALFEWPFRLLRVYNVRR